MIANETDYAELVNEEMEWAIAQRLRVRGEEEFKMRVRIVGPNGEVARTPIQWRNMQEKHLLMRALSEICMLTGARAATIVSDARVLHTENFCRVFNIAPPDPPNFEVFERERRRIMEGFAFYMGNLPRETWEESLMVMVYGPTVCRMATTKYMVSDTGNITFEPTIYAEDSAVKIFMLPKWWKDGSSHDQ